MKAKDVDVEWIGVMTGIIEVDDVEELRNKVLRVKKCSRCGKMTRSNFCPSCRKECWRNYVNGGGLGRWI